MDIPSVIINSVETVVLQEAGWQFFLFNRKILKIYFILKSYISLLLFLYKADIMKIWKILSECAVYLQGQ